MTPDMPDKTDEEIVEAMADEMDLWIKLEKLSASVEFPCRIVRLVRPDVKPPRWDGGGVAEPKGDYRWGEGGAALRLAKARAALAVAEPLIIARWLRNHAVKAGVSITPSASRGNDNDMPETRG